VVNDVHFAPPCTVSAHIALRPFPGQDDDESDDGRRDEGDRGYEQHQQRRFYTDRQTARDINPALFLTI